MWQFDVESPNQPPNLWLPGSVRSSDDIVEERNASPRGPGQLGDGVASRARSRLNGKTWRSEQ